MRYVALTLLCVSSLLCAAPNDNKTGALRK
jgi:hypothetical protein